MVLYITIQQIVINLYTKYVHSSLHGCWEIFDKNLYFKVWKKRKLDKYREE